jgi:Ran GTPase-activating protein (RanGAP) involved in mRNA processing and transport
LNLFANQIGNEGVQYFADILQINKVRAILQSSTTYRHYYHSTQTLTAIHFPSNDISDNGVQHLARMLQNNTVSKLSFILLLYPYRSKTLTTLDLHQNNIGCQGAQYLAKALEYNTVRQGYHSFTTRLSIFFEIDADNTQP